MQTVLDRLRQPEYTGANRCFPCTVANSAIAVLIAVGVSVGTRMVASSLVAGFAGGAVLVLAAGAIWLRGYLIPGTPTLTKRYMPPWMLRLFGKAPPPAADTPHHVDAESILTASGILEPCPDSEGLCLSASFKEQWRDAVRPDDGVAELTGLLQIDAVDQQPTQDRTHGALVISGDRQRWGKWPSRAAIQADVATARLLRDDLDGWPVYHPVDRAALLRSVRTRLPCCPDGTAVRVHPETVSSCCSDREVIAVECQSTGERLVEERPV